MSLREGARAAWLSPSRLTIRLILVLTLAILPLGLVSMYQSWRVLQGTQALSQADLLDRTRRAVGQERDLIEHSFGAAKALAGAVVALGPKPEKCDLPFSSLVEADATFSFAGFADDKGRIRCASNGSRVDIAKTAFYGEMVKVKGPSLHLFYSVSDDGHAAFSFAVPVEGKDLRGLVWVTVALATVKHMLGADSDKINLVLFDKTGKILATKLIGDDQGAMLPEHVALSELPGPVGYTFSGITRKGGTGDFAVVPIAADKIYALGSWAAGSGRLTILSWRSFGLYFPALIWLVCVAVAVGGLHRMVIRHFNRLRRWMQLYADHRVDFEDARLDRAPEELEAVAETFRMMTRRIAAQDRQREEDLKEKTTLLREVHHRVKNNLQVISSIMNMQARNTQNAEARYLIRRLQDRVMALASIHRHLYLARRLSVLRADELLEDIIGNLVVIGDVDARGKPVRFSTHFDAVTINPDQSMPLSLILTEAATNAVKYCGSRDGGQSWIDITLQAGEEGQVCLSVVNSCAPADPEAERDADGPAGTGLGISLIVTFAAQLDATLEHQRLADRYELHLTFTPAPQKNTQDEDAWDDSAGANPHPA